MSCIPSADFASISTFPPQVKAPIVALSVVLSVVVVVAVIVVVFLVRKLSALKKVGDAGLNLKANAASVGASVGASIVGGSPDIEANLRGKLPDMQVDVNRPHVGIDGAAGAVGLAFDKAAGLGANFKGAVEGSLQVALDIGLELDNPFFSIFNALPFASILVDTNGVIVRANVACNKKWGYPSADLEGKLYKILVSPKELEARLASINGLIQGHASFALDSYDVRIDGAQIDVEVYGSLIRILGKAYVFIITGHVCYTASGKRYKDD